MAEASWAGVHVRNGPPGGGDYQAAHLCGVLSDQTLVDGRVLGVDREEARCGAAEGGGDEFAGNHHCLLVGQGNVFPGLDGAEGGGEAAVAHGGRNHRVEAVGGHGIVDGLLAGRCGDAERCQGVAQFPVKRFVGDYCHLRAPFQSLLYECVDLAPRHEERGAEAVGIFGDYVERLRAYRACRPEDGYAFGRLGGTAGYCACVGGVHCRVCKVCGLNPACGPIQPTKLRKFLLK